MSQNACERLLNQLVRIEEQTTCRAAASSEAVMVIRHAASHYELSELQSELMEGLFIHDLYGIPNTPNTPLSVGDLAQMMAPETYPNNCLEVVEAIGYLIKQDLLELFDSVTTTPSLRSRVGLGPAIMKELLTHLATDIVNDTDLKAAKRRLSFSRSWPF